jgi:hypothetical protein
MAEAVAAADDEARARRQKAAGGGIREGKPGAAADAALVSANGGHAEAPEVAIPRTNIHHAELKRHDWHVYAPKGVTLESLDGNRGWDSLANLKLNRFDDIRVVTEDAVGDFIVIDTNGTSFADVRLVRKIPLPARVVNRQVAPPEGFRVRPAEDGELPHGGSYIVEMKRGDQWQNVIGTKGADSYIEGVSFAHQWKAKLTGERFSQKLP